MEARGVAAAVLSSALGGTAIGATRYLAEALDPITIGAIRFGGGFLALLPIMLMRGENWPASSDRLPAAALGVLFFCIFPFLFNAALIYTTAARGALIARNGPLPIAAFGMGMGALCLGILSIGANPFQALSAFDRVQWLSVAYLAIVCGALIFFLWAFALRYTTATVVTVSVTVNPVTAAIFGGLLLGEPVGPSLAIGLIAVLAGIALTTAGQARPARRGRKT